MEKEQAKQNNKNMLRASLLAGGFALSILIAFTFITIGGSYIAEDKSAKEDADYYNKKDAKIFVEGLTYIANKQYQEKIDYSAVSNYVTSISSVEYKNDGLKYCAVAQKHGLESSLLVVEISYNFETMDNCVATINHNYTKKDTFTVSSTLYVEENSEEAKSNIKTTFESKASGFNSNNPYAFNVYEAKSMFAASLTYKDSDTSYSSIVMFKPLSENVPFSIKYETNKTMYYILENITTNK